MKNYIIYFLSFLSFLSFASCYLTGNRLTDVTVGKSFESKSKRVTIETLVDKYSPSKKWFYGTIKICNKTKDTLKFNFNQVLMVDNLSLLADYNIFPISYAQEAFDIKPNSCSTWNVAWACKKEIENFEDINIKADTQMFITHYPITIGGVGTADKTLDYLTEKQKTLGIYEYVYEHNTIDLIENHFIQLEKNNNLITGTYYGTSDDFDEAREEYLPGFFKAKMFDLILTGTTITFKVVVNSTDMYVQAITPFDNPKNNKLWTVGVRNNERTYYGNITGDSIIITTKDFDRRVFVKKK